MEAFGLDQTLRDGYASFSRSFSRIRAADLQREIDLAYAGGAFWPEPLLSINPQFLRGPSAQALAADGTILTQTAQVFRARTEDMPFHTHQGQAIVKATMEQNFVVTTGTGSGKSMCFFVPVIDRAIRLRLAGQARATRAIIVYPMNALANSQLAEIRDKFLKGSGLADALCPTVARHTGQESQAERRAVADDPPDILLTNCMMLELLLTRQDDLGRKVIANCAGLNFIVLDELHTYRGRQGADVAVLIRRLRDRCGADPLCIGTSATMASEESDTDRKDKDADTRRKNKVAEAEARLFGAPFADDAVIDESLRRVTVGTLAETGPRLAAAVTAPLPATLPEDDLRTNPLAIWAELALGLDEGMGLRRRKPVPLDGAATLLARATDLDPAHCRTALAAFLTRASQPETLRGGTSTAGFLAFKLHRFFAGSGEVYTTLAAPDRHVHLDEQLEDPADHGTLLYPTRFCRACGQEVHVVTLTDTGGTPAFCARNMDDTPRKNPDDDATAGYLVPVDGAQRFTGDLDSYPEDWLDPKAKAPRLRSDRKKRAPRRMTATSDGGLRPTHRECSPASKPRRRCTGCWRTGSGRICGVAGGSPTPVSRSSG